MSLGPRILILSTVTFPWLLAGCGSPLPDGAKPTAPVTVFVKYKGAPVDGASVMFIKTGDESTPGFGTHRCLGLGQIADLRSE